MWDEKSLVTAKKRQSPQVQMCAMFVALIKISVHDYGRKTKYILTGNLFKIFECQ